MKFFIPIVVILAFASTAQAETIKAAVNGLVCSFCATGIEKTFKSQPAVDQVKVDLDAKLVTIITRKGATLPDDEVTKLLTNSGYTVTGITREK